MKILLSILILFLYVFSEAQTIQSDCLNNPQKAFSPHPVPVIDYNLHQSEFNYWLKLICDGDDYYSAMTKVFWIIAKDPSYQQTTIVPFATTRGGGVQMVNNNTIIPNLPSSSSMSAVVSQEKIINNCRIDADISCVASGAIGTQSWQVQSPFSRNALYSDYRIRSDAKNCKTMAQILKTECAIVDPVMYIFSDGIENVETGYILLPDPNLSENTDLPEIFNQYFSGKLVPLTSSLSMSVGSTNSSISLNENGQLVSSSNQVFNFGDTQKETICTKINNQQVCADKDKKDSSYKLKFENGILKINSDIYGNRYQVNVQNYSNSKLEFLKQWPFVQITSDEGIAWAASNKFSSFNLAGGQAIHLSSDVAYQNIFLMLQKDGNVLLRNIDTGQILWSSDTTNSCLKLKLGCTQYGAYNLSLDSGYLRLYYNKQLIWSAFDSVPSSNLGYYLKITATSPYLALYKIIATVGDPSLDGIKYWPVDNKLRCQSITAGAVTCLHPDMPLYIQYDKNLIDYINSKAGTNFKTDNGWCTPTALAMASKTYAIEKQKYFDEKNNIFPAKTNSFLDSDNSNELIWSLLGTLGKNESNGTIKIASMPPKYIGGGVSSDALIFNDILPMIPSANKQVANASSNIGFAYYKKNEIGFGVNAKIADRERVFLSNMPIGVVTTYNHTLAVNGLESSKYLKIFDPWGSVYDVDVTSEMNGKMKYIHTENEVNAKTNSAIVLSGGVAQFYGDYLLSNYVPMDNVTLKDCNLGGAIIRDGEQIKAYNRNDSCSLSLSEMRTCNRGKLDRSYPYTICDDVNVNSANGLQASVSTSTTTTVPTTTTTSTTTTSTTTTTTTTIPKPAITKQPNPTYFVASGGVLQLSVEASGLNLKYQWYKDNSLIANASANAYQIAPGAAGVYRVRVSNSSGYVDSNSAMVIIASPCYFGANKVEHGSSVFAYAKPTSENCENEKQSRTCNNGVLSGNNFYPSCQQIKNCTYNGQTVAHGGTVDVYSSAVATVCVKVKRGCNNGVINLAATDVPTCREYKSCSFAGAVIPHGQSVVAYANDVSGDCSKESQRRICDDGILQGSYSKTNCRQGRTCNFVAQDDGTAVTLGVFHGSTVKAYRVSMSQNCESEIQKRLCNDGVLDGTYTQATCHAPRSCNFNGAVVAHNNMVTAYANAVSSNCAGESEKRVCIDGKLSGSKNQSSCREPKSCTFAGDIVPHGQSVIAYGNSGSKNCESEKEKRVCNDGVLSGYSSYKTCTESKSCTYNGQTIAHGASLEVYSEAVSANCVKVKRICNNGVITFQATDSLTCTAPTTTTSTTTTTLATKSCTFNGNKVAHNTSVKAYLNTVSNSCEREVENRLCVNGVLQGSYTQSSCRQFRSCDFAGTTVAHGGSITAYLNPVSANCAAERETRTCDDGVLRGSYTQTKCQAPGDCEFNGQMIASGKVVTAYKNAVSSSCNTERQLRLCSNGVLRGTYQYDSCRER